MKNIFIICLLTFAFLTNPPSASAHAFGAIYRLPIPFEMYLWTAGAALVLSFILIGVFSKNTKSASENKRYDISGNRLVRWLTSPVAQASYKILSVFLLLITIVTGLIGDSLSAFNVSMTFFWIIFVVGFTYLVMLVGNIWEVVNPWKILVEWYEQVTKHKIIGVLKYPPSWNYYPAYILYLLFIAIELFGGTTPFALGVLLMQYTIVTLFAVCLFGKKTWFEYGEFFSVFFRFVSLASAFITDKKKIYLQIPFMSLLDKKAGSLSVVLFILFMLASTAFDGFRETNAWFFLYWDWFSLLFGGVFGGEWGFHLFEIVGLVFSPLLFLLLFLVCMTLMKVLTDTKVSVLTLTYRYVYSLIPIALVYNLAHYFTLLVLQGQGIVRLISDPFGWGWNLFGTANVVPPITTLPAAFVWHFQVSLILTGHIISVYISHRIAQKTYTSSEKVLVSQIPLLILMVLYTVIGLWILSQPIAAS